MAPNGTLASSATSIIFCAARLTANFPNSSELGDELRDCPTGRVRRPGGGRPRAEKKTLR